MSRELATIFATYLSGSHEEYPRIYEYETFKKITLAVLPVDQAIDLEISSNSGKFSGRLSNAAKSFCSDTKVDGWIIKNLYNEFGREDSEDSESDIDDIMLCEPMNCLSYLKQRPINLQHYVESMWVNKLRFKIISKISKSRFRRSTLVGAQEFDKKIIKLMNDILEFVDRQTDST